MSGIVSRESVVPRRSGSPSDAESSLASRRASIDSAGARSLRLLRVRIQQRRPRLVRQAARVPQGTRVLRRRLAVRAERPRGSRGRRRVPSTAGSSPASSRDGRAAKDRADHGGPRARQGARRWSRPAAAAREPRSRPQAGRARAGRKRHRRPRAGPRPRGRRRAAELSSSDGLEQPELHLRRHQRDDASRRARGAERAARARTASRTVSGSSTRRRAARTSVT